jgi:hypothetical protein
MPTYRDADKGAHALLREVLDESYSDLAEHGVTIELLEALAPRDEKTGEPKGPALVRNGLALVTKSTVNSQERRAAGSADCKIHFDGDVWAEMSEARRRAEMDAALHAFEIQSDDQGQAKLDDCHRPKLRIRPPDVFVSGYTPVISRHGWQAGAVIALRDAVRQVRQLSFGWDDAGGPAAEPALPAVARAEKAARQFIDSLPAGSTATLSVDGMDPVTVSGPAGAA